MTLPTGVQRRSFDGVEGIATRGEPVYDEPVSEEWRYWDPNRSKLGAIFEMGVETGLTGGDSVLYLGAAAGTTVSHVADFAGPTYAIEFAPRPMKDLLTVVETRPNLFPLLKDARQPDTYSHIVEHGLDAIIQDVATAGQAEVAIRNRRFLAADGRLILAIKARSEDVTKEPASVFEAALDTLEPTYDVLETARLEPRHAAHLAVVATPST